MLIFDIKEYFYQLSSKSVKLTQRLESP